MPDPNPHTRPRDDFYVGYLPMPVGLRAFTIAACLVVAILSLGAVVAAALAQRDPGPGFWSALETNEMFDTNGQPIPVEGILRLSPYPVLHVTSGAPVGAYLIVELGKFGSRDRLLAFADQQLRVNAWILERSGRRMLELAPDSADVTPTGLAMRDTPPPTPLGRFTGDGEILDSKCYLGAMSPGDGAAHRACATLCIAGGIPPMFVSLDDRGRRIYHILTTPDGGPANEQVLPLVGRPVTIEGAAHELDGVRYLRAERITPR